MRKAVTNKLRYIRDTTSVSSILIHLKYWWYTREQSRLLVLFVLSGILIAAAFMVQYSVQQQTYLKQLNCLALNIYHEARGEPRAGQQAVAEVTLNRVLSRHYPESICEVVYQQRWDSIRKRYVSAFSWTEVDPDGAPDPDAWIRARVIAEAAYHKQVKPKLNGAVFYHARYVRPSWAKKQTEVARIGRHIFYK